jgi:pilus assembly protein CpaC
VGNPAVLETLTAAPDQVVITAKAAGVSSVILWDEAGKTQEYLVSVDTDVEALRASIKQLLPTDAVIVRGQEDKISLTGTVTSDASATAAVKLATLYSKDVASSLIVNPTHPKQVKLKVRIVEVDRSRLNQFGINFFAAGGSTIAGTSTSQFPVGTSLSSSGGAGQGGNSVGGETLTVSDPLNFLLYSSKLNAGLVVKDLENKQILQILAEPTITTVSGEKANFLAGGEFPFPVVQSSTSGLASVTIQFRPYGVKLEFTPIVNSDGTIQLKVAPEVSALDYTNAVTISGYTIPALSTRRAETQVELRSGQSFAISGLLDQRTTDALGSTPGISRIPILGELFKSKGITHSTTELVVIVTPTVVDPLSDVSNPDEPHLPVSMLSTDTFDKTLPHRLTTK